VFVLGILASYLIDLKADRDLLEADRDHSQLMTRTQKLVNSELTPIPNQNLRAGPSPFIIESFLVAWYGAPQTSARADGWHAATDR